MTEFTGEVHPVADLFPMLDDTELADLAEDIAARGLLQPVVLDADGRLLDGRNRLAACAKAGVDPTFTTYDGDDPDGYALTVNITRRHLTTGARAILAEQARRLSGKTQKEAALSDYGNSHNQYRYAEAGVVLDWAPDIAGAVVAGVTPLSTAVDTARARKRDAEALDAKLIRLATEAPDLRALVDEERLSADDAVRTLDGRQSEAQRIAVQEAADRRRVIDDARSHARTIVTTLQANCMAVIGGYEAGETNLLTPDDLDTMREAINLMEDHIDAAR